MNPNVQVSHCLNIQNPKSDPMTDTNALAIVASVENRNGQSSGANNRQRI